MIQHTLSTSLALYHVNRDRAQIELYFAKRRAGFLSIAIFVVLAIGVMAWILQ